MGRGLVPAGEFRAACVEGILMTDRDPKTGRFVRPDVPQPPAWTVRDTVWAVIGFVGLVAAFFAALLL